MGENYSPLCIEANHRVLLFVDFRHNPLLGIPILCLRIFFLQCLEFVVYLAYCFSYHGKLLEDGACISSTSSLSAHSFSPLSSSIPTTYSRCRFCACACFLLPICRGTASTALCSLCWKKPQQCSHCTRCRCSDWLITLLLVLVALTCRCLTAIFSGGTTAPFPFWRDWLCVRLYCSTGSD